MGQGSIKKNYSGFLKLTKNSKDLRECSKRQQLVQFIEQKVSEGKIFSHLEKNFEI